MAPTSKPAISFVLAVAMLLPGGCTPWREYVRNGFKVGPNYCPPPAPVAESWIDAGDARLKPVAADLSQWWTVLGDPTLDALVVNAVQQNLTVREAGFRVLQARAFLAITRGTIFPQQQVAAGGFTRNVLSTEQANGQFIQNRWFDQWDVGFSLNWELDFWGRFRRAIEAAEAELDASVETYDQVLVTLLGDIASTYAEIRTVQQRLEFAQTNVKLQQETFTIAQARYRGGQVTELDVDQAASALAQTESLIPQLELQLRFATNRMCILLGTPPTDLVQTLGVGAIPEVPAELIVGIPADLLRQRPDVRRAEREVAAQSARVGIATAELYPHIGITGTIGYQAENFSRLFSQRAFTGVVGPVFEWNILNYGRLINAIRLQDARLAELIVAYQQQVLQAQVEVENGIAQFLRSLERARALAESVEASERAVQIALVQYRGGLTDFNRVALLEQNLVEQQDRYAVAQGDVVQGLVATYRALGGGWQIRLQPLPGEVPIPPASRPPIASPIHVMPDDAAKGQQPANHAGQQAAEPILPPPAINPQEGRP
jgi:NodT family efflux transporter outer membrane factor (OMF) lipoprotein